MKLLFYGTDGAAGKARAMELRKGPPKMVCRLIHAEACREAEECDDIEFMPDVPPFERARISTLFGKTAWPSPEAAAAIKANALGLKVGLGPGGRIYIRKGREMHSGPFDTVEAAEAALAKELSTA
jgi:hypothetical protein